MRSARIIVVVVAAAAGLLITSLIATGRIWWRSNRYAVAVVPAKGVSTKVYVGREALLLVLEGEVAESYVVYPRRHELGVALRHRFVMLPDGALSLDNPATYVPLGKLEVPVERSFGEHQVRFVGAHGESVTIRW